MSKTTEGCRLPDIVAAAFATVRHELPSTYPSRTPNWIYFLKPGHKSSEPVSAWYKLPFATFAPYIEHVRTTSDAVYYRLRKEHQQHAALDTALVHRLPSEADSNPCRSGEPAPLIQGTVRASSRRTYHFQLQYDPADIPKFAAEYMETDAGEDAKAEEAGRSIASGQCTRSNLEIIVEWKSARALHLLERNTDAAIEQALQRAVNAGSVREAVECLTCLCGVAVRMASATFTAINPERYTVLDFRALHAQGIPDAEKVNYTVGLYISYLEACRSMAKNYGVTLRDFDRANWQWSKRQSGTRVSRCAAVTA